MSRIVVYVDGSSTGKSDAPCGWGWLVVDWTNEKIICAGCDGNSNGTNSIAELMGAICGLRTVFERELHRGNDVVLVSDSQYALNMANSRFKPNKYHQEVQLLQSLLGATGAKTQWVKGHSGDIFNSRVDKLAKLGKMRHTPSPVPTT
jgi:ribonuclease HI